MAEQSPNRSHGHGRHRLRRLHAWRANRWTSIPVPLGVVVAVAVGSLPVAATIVHLGAPHQPWTHSLTAVLAIGWAAPLSLVAALTLIGAVRERAARRNDISWQVQSASLLASRARFYLDCGHPDPLRAAAFDFAAYTAGQLSPTTAELWHQESLQWFADHAVETGLPAPVQVY